MGIQILASPQDNITSNTNSQKCWHTFVN